MFTKNDSTTGRLPNFLLIGAPKAGTTAIYHYLKQHPEIFMSPVKEARFFGDEGVKSVTAIRDLEKYKALFQNVTTQKIWGEATPDYLCSPSAATQIKTIIPEAKLVAIIRNPVDRAYSHYIYMSRIIRHQVSNKQDLPKYIEYKKLVDKTPKPLNIPPISDENDFLYLRPSLYAEDLKRYYQLFGKDKIQILLYDDLKANPVKTMHSIFYFLGVDPEFVPDVTQKHNITGVPKNEFLDEILISSNWIKTMAKLFLPKKIRISVASSMYKANIKPYDSLDTTTRSILMEVFRDDILQTQDLIQRDLRSWLS
jgi:hypothetical protein